MSLLHVVGAAIIGPDGVLAALRSPTMSTPDVWEFPGGKVERGESPEQALAREIREELAVDVVVGNRLGIVETSRIRLVVHEVRIVRGTPVANEHSELRWVGPDDLQTLRWAEADRPLLAPLADVLRRLR